MSTSIDERVVALKFQNSNFTKDTAAAASSLDKLKNSLSLKGATDGLAGVDAAAKKLSLEGIAKNVENIGARFQTMSIVAITALANIANRAVNVGIQMAKSLTIDPVAQGLAEYELKMGSIQTIMAGTGASLDTVNGYLGELNTYADKTIYSFADMTNNIGKFTNAGVSLDQSVAAIQGIANVAALSGANSNEASRAMYNFSQALSKGYVQLIDWKSIELANMGTVEFKTQLLEAAEAAGTLTKEGDGWVTSSGMFVSATKNFNDSLTDQWLTTDALNGALSKYSDETTDIGKRAFAAAQDIKTFTQLMDTLAEAAGSGWAETGEILIGDFEEAKALWTGVNNVISGMMDDQATARNEYLQEWKTLGGRDKLISGLASGFDALMSVLETVKSAFATIFPPSAANQLLTATMWFKQLMESLKPTAAQTNNLYRIFRGLFAVLDIVWMAVKGLVGVFVDLFSEVSKGTDGILDFGGGIGDALHNLRNMIKDGELFGKIFETIGNVLGFVVGILGQIGSFVLNIVSFESFSDAVNKVGQALGAIWDFFAPVRDFLVEAFGEVKNAFASAFENMDFNVLVGLLNTGLLGAIILGLGTLKSKLGGFLGDLFDGASGGLVEGIKDAFGALTDTMGDMQNKLKAETLTKIAIAIALLTASVVALSFVDTDKVAISLGAMAVMFGQLLGALSLFEKTTNSLSVAKLVGIGTALILLSGAILLLSVALLIIAQLEWDELARGLSGMAGGLIILIGALKLMSGQTKTVIPVAFAIGILSGALLILAFTLKQYSDMNWVEIATGLGGMAAALLLMAGGMKVLSKAMAGAKGIVAGAFAIAIVAAALMLLSVAMGMFAAFSWEEIGRGLVAMGGALAIVAVAISLIPVSALAGAGALVLASLALTVVAKAMQEFATLSWDDIGRAIVLLAGSLVILAAGMALMGIPLVLLGAVGLTAAAIALSVLAPVLILLGNLSWEVIGTGLGALAAALGIIAVGGILLLAALPGLLGLGIATMLIGTGAFLAGLGLTAFAAGMSVLLAAGAQGVQTAKLMLMELITVIPDVATALAEGIIQFAVTIAEGGAEFTAAMTTLLQSMIDSINELAPQIIDTLWDLLMQMVAKLEENVPLMVDSGLKLLTGILEGIRDNIGDIVTVGAEIVEEFLGALEEKIPDLVDKGFDMLIGVIEGIEDSVRSNSQRLGEAGGNLAVAIVDGMVNGIGAGLFRVTEAARNLANSVWETAKSVLNINSPSKVMSDLGGWVPAGLAQGIFKRSSMAVTASKTMANATVSTMKKTLSGVGNAISEELDLNPTIQPVWDLTMLEKGIAGIDTMLSEPNLNVLPSYNRAVGVAQEYEDNWSANSDYDETSEGVSLTFNQYNSSPKTLPESEIYRNSKNILTIAKNKLEE